MSDPQAPLEPKLNRAAFAGSCLAASDPQDGYRLQCAAVRTRTHINQPPPSWRERATRHAIAVRVPRPVVAPVTPAPIHSAWLAVGGGTSA